MVQSAQCIANTLTTSLPRGISMLIGPLWGRYEWLMTKTGTKDTPGQERVNSLTVMVAYVGPLLFELRSSSKCQSVETWSIFVRF